MQAKLLIRLNNSLVGDFSIENEVTTIGRRSENDISLDELSVSGKHARVLFMGGEAFLEDLESTNGTYVNSEKISKHLLKNGDLITVGQFQLKFEAVQAESDAFEKAVVVKPYAVGLEGTASFQAATLEQEQQKKDEAAAAKMLASGERPALLQLLSGPNNGKKMALTRSITRLGKPGEQSAAIAKRPQGYFIMHLGGSALQPLLNGKKVGTQAAKLTHEDVIEMGKIRMKVMIPS